MFQNDSLFFVGVFAFIFVLWLVTGGPTHPLSFAGPLLSGPGPLGGGTYLSLPGAPSVGDISAGQSHAGGSTGEGGASTYRGIVSLSHSVANAGGDPQKEYLQIFVSSQASGPVDLTGWRVVSQATGAGATIPQGTETPASGTINPVQPVILNPGDRALVISGRSPIGGSFRENKCIGYFGEFQTFYPSLASSCPDPSSELEASYGPDLIRDASCIDYVNRLSRCTIPLSPPVNLSSACQNFLTTRLNYNGCVAAHGNDANFKSSEWRIYLGSSESLWRKQHELIELVDPSGTVVDSFSY